jgi:Carboxypeptidase regulatory-like domain
MLKKLTVVLFVLVLGTFAFGQKKNPAPAEKSVSGVVTDAGGAPVPGAIVQLKNLKTLQVRSFIAKEMGEYYFQGLATDVDYELKADFNGKSSGPRQLSSFDSHAEARVNLQLK